MRESLLWLSSVLVFVAYSFQFQAHAAPAGDDF